MKRRFLAISMPILIATIWLFCFINNSRAETNTKTLWPTSLARPVISKDRKSTVNDIKSLANSVEVVPSINEPKFRDPNTADTSDTSLGIGICKNDTCKFYPFSILLWHETINDYLDNTPILVFYSDTNQISAVYDREVLNETLMFSNSTKNWLSVPLLQTDSSKNESLWSPILGEAVSGLRVRQQLRPLHSQIITLKDWLILYPKSAILSKATGYIRPYNADIETLPLVTPKIKDNRLPADTLVAGIYINSKFIAMPIKKLAIGEIKYTINGVNIIITKYANGIVEITSKDKEGFAPIIYSSWADWSATHPQSFIISTI